MSNGKQPPERQLVDRDPTLPRMETGPVQFSNDWTGIFIRGDNAFGFAVDLQVVLNELPHGLIKASLTELQDLLLSAKELTNDVQKTDHEVAS